MAHPYHSPSTPIAHPRVNPGRLFGKAIRNSYSLLLTTQQSVTLPTSFTIWRCVNDAGDAFLGRPPLWFLVHGASVSHRVCGLRGACTEKCALRAERRLTGRSMEQRLPVLLLPSGSRRGKQSQSVIC
eukprot:2304358-Pyramimonas_sp.AAC.1